MDPFTCSEVLFILHQNKHWFYGNYYVKQNLVLVTDSIHNQDLFQSAKETIENWIKEEGKRLGRKSREVTTVQNNSVPKQTDQNSCGIHMLENIRAHTMGYKSKMRTQRHEQAARARWCRRLREAQTEEPVEHEMEEILDEEEPVEHEMEEILDEEEPQG